jgi:hypothetical protein
LSKASLPRSVMNPPTTHVSVENQESAKRLTQLNTPSQTPLVSWSPRHGRVVIPALPPVAFSPPSESSSVIEVRYGWRQVTGKGSGTSRKPHGVSTSATDLHGGAQRLFAESRIRRGKQSALAASHQLGGDVAAPRQYRPGNRWIPLLGTRSILGGRITTIIKGISHVFCGGLLSRSSSWHSKVSEQEGFRWTLPLEIRWLPAKGQTFGRIGSHRERRMSRKVRMDRRVDHGPRIWNRLRAALVRGGGHRGLNESPIAGRYRGEPKWDGWGLDQGPRPGPR